MCQPEAINYIDEDATIWERAPMEKIAAEGQMAAFRHEGFWKPMDTLRDKNELEEDWVKGEAQWKLWK